MNFAADLPVHVRPGAAERAWRSALVEIHAPTPVTAEIDVRSVINGALDLSGRRWNGVRRSCAWR